MTQKCKNRTTQVFHGMLKRLLLLGVCIFGHCCNGRAFEIGLEPKIIRLIAHEFCYKQYFAVICQSKENGRSHTFQADSDKLAEEFIRIEVIILTVIISPHLIFLFPHENTHLSDSDTGRCSSSCHVLHISDVPYLHFTRSITPSGFCVKPLQLYTRSWLMLSVSAV